MKKKPILRISHRHSPHVLWIRLTAEVLHDYNPLVEITINSCIKLLKGVNGRDCFHTNKAF